MVRSYFIAQDAEEVRRVTVFCKVAHSLIMLYHLLQIMFHV